MQSIVSGDAQAMAELYERYWEKLFINAWNVLKDKDAVEDILHDVFCDIWKRRDEISKVEIPEGYLMRAVRFQVLKYIRHCKVKKHVFAKLNEASSSFLINQGSKDDNDLNEKIIDAINNLPPQCQEVFRLSRIEELSHKEIADKLHISPKTVERHITIAFQKLKSHFGRALLSFLLLLIYFF